MLFQELERKISQYLILEDKFVVKLLCATIIANRIAELDNTWLFLVSSSSGGKSELLLALSQARACMQKDDLTAKTFVSGAKSGNGGETSLIGRLPPDCVMIVKDLTVLLKKDERESAAIFSQLRMIYDGSFHKSFGTGQDISQKVRMGLIAGVTSVIEDYQADDAAVGQRAIKYYMSQPDEEKLDELTASIIGGKQDKAFREMIGKAFTEYLDGNPWDLTNIPDLLLDIRIELAKLSNMATKARSSVKRKQYDRNNRIERKNLREMPFRFGKQLGNLAMSLMIMNKHETGIADLTLLDKAMLFKVCLDSIPSSRKEVMIEATKYAFSTAEGLALALKVDIDSVKIYLGDLIAMGIMTGSRGMNNKFTYQLNETYRILFSKYENLELGTGTLDVVDQSPDEDPGIAIENLI
jgi:hypothetical protein